MAEEIKKDVEKEAEAEAEKQQEAAGEIDAVDALTEAEAKQALKEFRKTATELTGSIEALTAEAAKNKDSWYRTAAEFENFKRRNEGVRKTAYDDGKKDAVTGILPIGDAIDRALTMVTDEKTLEGVKLIARSFKEALSAIGVEQIDPLGEAFNPETAEAIATLPLEDGDEPDTVKTVFKKGYTLNGKIIRYAQVVVSKQD